MKPSVLLHSIEKEIDNATRNYEETLSAKIDSLRQNNRILNRHINLLVHNFEQKEQETFCREIRWQQETRNHTFRLIAGIGIGAFLLVILLYMVIHRDVNRQYKIRTKLENSNRRNEELLRTRKNMMLTVSHDLRAPLGTISGYAELLQDEKSMKRSKGYAINILRASHHVIGLANNLLYYYRLEEMASLSAEKWCKELDGRIKRVMIAVEQAVRKAKELKDKPDENHIGSRG